MSSIKRRARLVESGQSQAAAARSLGVIEQTLCNWVKAHRAGTLTGASSKLQVTAEQMENSRLRAELARVTMFKRNPGKQAGLIFHSDRGSQYASEDFSEVLREHGITPSMSCKGNCRDNACSETLFGSLKVERLHGQRFRTIRAAKDEVIAWPLWYNRIPMHSTLNCVSPIEFEQDWTDATVMIAALVCEVIEAGRGNDGLWNARKSMMLFFALPTNLGNRSSRFPHSHRHDDEDEFNPQKPAG